MYISPHDGNYDYWYNRLYNDYTIGSLAAMIRCLLADIHFDVSYSCNGFSYTQWLELVVGVAEQRGIRVSEL